MPFTSHLLLWMIDPSPGKVEKSTMSQQTLMELFIEGIDNKERVCRSADDPTDISEWSKIVFNDHLEIVEINWTRVNINGSIALQWLPPTLRKLEIVGYIFSSQRLEGTIDLTALPESLTHINLSVNNLMGTIVLTSLPVTMKVVDLSRNNMSGTLDLTKLPSLLEILNLSWNDFAGVTDFGQLPSSLKELNLAQTNLEGIIYQEAVNAMCTVDGSRIIVE